MNEIFLDGCSMTSKETAHTYIKERLNFPPYYGDNLDALWDILTTYSNAISIYLINEEALNNNLGEYGMLLKGVFQDAAYENDNIHFVVLTEEN
jgi:ribonuclease inhibitor